MSFRFRNWFAGLTTLVPCLAFAADPSADQALMLTPIQADVQYEKPSEAEAKACTIRPETEGKANAWVVYSGDGTLLRRFVDTNGDKKLIAGAMPTAASRCTETLTPILMAKRTSIVGLVRLVCDGDWTQTRMAVSMRGNGSRRKR